MKITTTIILLETYCKIPSPKIFNVKFIENADGINQLSNTNRKYPKNDSTINNYTTKSPSSTTKAPVITDSSDFHHFNPFEPSAIKPHVFNTSILEFSKPIRVLEHEHRHSLVEASTTGYTNKSHGVNPFEPFTIKHPVSDFRLGAWARSKAS